MTDTTAASAARTSDDYSRIRAAPHHRRTVGGRRPHRHRPGGYEWWYFDAHLDGGAKVVVVFHNKTSSTRTGRCRRCCGSASTCPTAGRTRSSSISRPSPGCSAKDHADVRIGENRFTGDLRIYRITATVDEIAVDITIEREVSSWRPGNRLHAVRSKERNLEFSWLPAVPQGKVTAKYSIGDETARDHGHRVSRPQLGQRRADGRHP